MSDEPTPRAIRTSRGAPTRDEPMLVLTGMSGAGRSTMANVLEDLGWYVVDNLPPQMLPQLLRAPRGVPGPDPGADDPPRRRRRRRPQPRGASPTSARSSPSCGRAGHRPSVVFLDATDEALVRRFESVRRPHPLQASGRLLDGIQRERALLGELRSEADVILDTSGLNVHQLAAKAMSLFAGDGAAQLRSGRHVVRVQVRRPARRGLRPRPPFPAEPVLGPELRPLTGPRRAGGASSSCPSRAPRSSSTDVVHLMDSVVKGFVREGRRYVTLALGCTGGKHRSVAIGEQLAERLRSDARRHLPRAPRPRTGVSAP